MLRDSFNLSLDAVPRVIDLAGIREYLAGLQEGVKIHDRFGIEHATIQIEADQAEACCPLDHPHCLSRRDL